MTHSYTNEIWDFLQESQTLIARIHQGHESWGGPSGWWASLGHLHAMGLQLLNRMHMESNWEDENQHVYNSFIATLNIIRFLVCHDGPELYINSGFWEK